MKKRYYVKIEPRDFKKTNSKFVLN